MNFARSPQSTPTPLPPAPLKDADGITHGVNWTHPTWLQSPWWTNPVSCHRPPAKLTAPLVCVATIAPDAPERPHPFRLLSDGEDLDLFEPCCPRSDNATQLNLYTTRRSCPGPVCFTHDLGAARNWTECLRRRVGEEKARLEREGEGGRLEEVEERIVEGECEYVNWELVNMGLLDREKLPPGVSGAAKKGVGAVVVWGLLLMVGVQVVYI